ERLVLRLVADEAVVVVPLVLARPRLERRVGLRPADQPLINRPAAEHAAGRRVARENGAACDAGAGEAVRGLQAAPPRPHHHDVVLARRKRSLLYPSQALAARSRRASICSMRYITVGCLSRNGLSSVSGMIRQRSIVDAITSAVGCESVSSEISPKKSPR